MPSTKERYARRRTLFAFSVVLALANVVHAQDSEQVPADISSALQSIVSQTRIPGMAAVVLRGDRIVAQGAAGVRRKGSPEPIAVADQFQINSATKAMTATLVAMAIEDGKLSWNTTLGDLFPASKMNEDWKPVTLAQLLDHRAGVPNELTRKTALLRIHFRNGSVVEKRQRVLAGILRHRPAYPPGSKYVYSSLDYMMAAAMLEKATGHSWEELVQDRLWQPLGITSGGFGAPSGNSKVDQPWGHWGTFRTGHPVPPNGFWAHLNTPRFWGPGGNSHMTISDWAKFIALHLRGDPANPHHAEALIATASFASLHQAPPGQFYRAGWIMLDRPWANGHRAGDTGRVLSSQGDNYFWHSEAWVAPEIDFAVLIVINQGGPAPQNAASKASAAALQQLIHDFAPSTPTPGAP